MRRGIPGKYVYEEKYRPEEVCPIEKTIRDFMCFLERFDLIDLYAEKWGVK